MSHSRGNIFFLKKTKGNEKFVFRNNNLRWVWISVKNTKNPSFLIVLELIENPPEDKKRFAIYKNYKCLLFHKGTVRIVYELDHPRHFQHNLYETKPLSWNR